MGLLQEVCDEVSQNKPGRCFKGVMATVRPLASHPSRATISIQVSSFDQLFLEQYSRVVLIAYRVLGDRQAAEDIAQEVFLSFYGKVDASEDWAPSWLWAASAHKALNMARGEKRRQGRELRVLPSTGATGPEEDAIASQQRRVVRAALARIPQRQAEVLVLWASGLSYADIAVAVGVRPSGVGTLVCRAQHALRKELTNGKTPF